MDIRMSARVYNPRTGSRVVDFSVYVPEPMEDSWGLPYISPEQLDALLSESLLNDVQEPEVPRLPETELDLIAKRIRYRSSLESTGDVCAVCLEYFRPRMYVRDLPCGHRFCSKCIVQWVTGHTASCPTCRKAVAQ